MANTSETEDRPLGFGELPHPRLDDDHEANACLEIMSQMRSPARRAQWLAASSRAFARAERLGAR